jgi:hypothetical protein
MGERSDMTSFWSFLREQLVRRLSKARNALLWGGVALSVGFTCTAALSVYHREWCDKDDDATNNYRASHYWLLDKFGIGHRIEEILGRRSVLILRRAAPEPNGSLFPRVSNVMVPRGGECTWKVSEVFDETDEDYRAYGTRFAKQGTVRIWRFGFFEPDLGTGAEAFRMATDLWSSLRGRAVSACALCLVNGERSGCPRLSVMSDTSEETLNECD